MADDRVDKVRDDQRNDGAESRDDVAAQIPTDESGEYFDDYAAEMSPNEWEEYSSDPNHWISYEDPERHELQDVEGRSEREAAKASPPSFDLTAWERQTRQQLDQWLADWDAQDVQTRRAVTADTADPLNQTFVWHPQFKGRTRLDVYLEFRWLARQARANYVLFSHHPSPSDQLSRTVAGARSEWAQFSGSKGLDEDWQDWEELALQRLVFEVARDEQQRLDINFANVQRDLQRHQAGQTRGGEGRGSGSPAVVDPARAAAVEQGVEDISKGAGCAILGLIITGVTYFAAEGGGTYYVMWGAFAWGGFMVLRGLFTVLRNR